jgi:hypothetical protein
MDTSIAFRMSGAQLFTLAKAFAFLNHATQQIGPNPFCHQDFRVIFSSFSGWML